MSFKLAQRQNLKYSILQRKNKRLSRIIRNPQDLREHESHQVSRYFHIIGDGNLNPMVGVFIPIIGIPTKGGMTSPNIGSLDPRTCTTCL